jgi:transposase
MEGENSQELVKKQAEIIRKQAEMIQALQTRIVELETIIARLQKDSRNSSKPPSSDIVKPKTAAQKEGGSNTRKIGGQPGHKRHERQPFPAEQVDQFVEVTLQKCPCCGGLLEEDEREGITSQQIEIAPKPFIVTEYHRHSYWCPACGTSHTAPEPEQAHSGLFSIGLIALTAYLKGRCHISFRALKDFFQEVVGIRVSCGFLVKQIEKASGSLKETYRQLVRRLPGEKQLNIDESGWKEHGEKRWTWAFRAEKYAVFIIRDSRGEGVLEEILGLGYGGIITSDFFGAYRKYCRVAGARIQFCWAHLIREVLFLEKMQDGGVRRYGRRLIKQIRLMFQTIHVRGAIGERGWKGRMMRHRELIIKRAGGTVPEQEEAQLIAKRLKEWEEEYFRFIESGIEPTNNRAELAIRQTVLDRVVTQGSRGIRGNEWHERFWTVLTTCGLQDTSVMNYLKSCLSAYFGMGTYPKFINLTA